MAAENLTAARLRELLEYDPETGLFLRKIDSRRRPNTRVKAGSINALGYVVIYIAGRTYGAHRLAWLWVTGEWPPEDVDHINHDKTDNRFANLRAASRSLNMQNRIAVSPGRKAKLPLGVTHVPRNKTNPFAAQIVADRHMHLGYFPTPEEAHAAYVAAKRMFHPGGTL